ncbi:hypothetical protein ACQKWADRAFT_293602 [Trichoderma austrokoningii]
MEAMIIIAVALFSASCLGPLDTKYVDWDTNPATIFESFFIANEDILGLSSRVKRCHKQSGRFTELLRRVTVYTMLNHTA